jgi:hypothetical protein
MASSLELGKLVAASFLHKNWKHCSFFLKTYLTIAVAILMFITSLGIFGFLSNAYQVHKVKVTAYQTDQTTIEKQQANLNDELMVNTARIETLVALRKEQETRVTTAGNYRAPREQAYKAIETANSEIQTKEARQVVLRTQLGELEVKKAEITKELNSKTDIGSFQFIADALNTDVDTAVRYFIFSLVFVFDPLAVSLVLALNQLFELRELKKKKNKSVALEVKEETPPIEEEEKTKKASFVKREKPTVTGTTKEEKELLYRRKRQLEKNNSITTK